MHRRAAAFTMTAGAALAGLTFATVVGNTAAATAHPAAAAAAAAHPPYGEIVVSDNAAIRVYAPGAHGNVAPIRTITGAATGLNTSYPVKLDAAGNIWVAGFDNNTIEEFAATANGNVPPIRTITTPSSTDLDAPDGLALVPGQHRIWVGNDDSTTIAKFSTTANGSVSPTQRIVGSSTGITWSHDLALSPNGKDLWESDGGSSSLHEFATSGPPDQAPLRTIALGDTSTHYPEGIVVDPSGTVWTSDTDTNAIYGYGPNSDTIPIRTIAGSNTAIADPLYMCSDALGRLWVTSPGASPRSVEAFARTANGNVAPAIRIGGSKTGLQYPDGVAVYAAKPGAPRSVKAHGGKHKVAVHWRAPSSTGGGLLGYVVRRKNSKHAKWSVIAVTKKRQLTDHHRKAHHRYRYDVIAVNALGVSGASKTAAAVAHK